MMPFYNLHIIDISIIIGYLLLCLIIGFVSSKKIRNIRDYAIGSGHISTAVLVGTFFATDIGAAATVGVAQKIQTLGLVFIIAMLFRPFFWLVASYIFSKNIGYFKEAGCISISDIMEKTYGVTGRWITNVLSFLHAASRIALQVIALNYMFQYFLGISSQNCSIITFLVLVIYSVMGGIRAVAITDLMQAIVFFVGIPLACCLALDKLGLSYTEILERLPETHTSIDFTAKNISFMVSVALGYTLLGASIPFIQRYLMASNEAQLKLVMRDCFYLSIPFTITIILMGIVLTVISKDVNTNVSFYYLIDNYLPVGIKGFIITGMLAIIMSTADSWLNTASIICAHDILGKLFPELAEKRLLMIARISTMVIGFIAATIALNYSQGLMDFVWFTDNLWSPIIVAPLIYALFCKNSNRFTFISAGVFAVFGVALGWYIFGELAKTSSFSGIIGSTIGIIVANKYNTKQALKASS